MQSPPNDLVSGTTPVQQLMAAHLSPGGRFINYDPQAYASSAGSPQGVPDLNIIPGVAVDLGVRVDRERQLRIGDAHARAGRPRHRPARFRHPRPIGPPGDRDGARVLPRAARFGARVAVAACSRCPRATEPTPSSLRGYGANFNETAYPFYPGPRPSLQSGQTESWFFGESLEPASAIAAVHPRHRLRPRSSDSGSSRQTARRRGGRRCQWRSGATRVSAHLPRGHGDRPVRPGGRVRCRRTKRSLRWAATRTNSPAPSRPPSCRDRGTRPARRTAMSSTPPPSRRSRSRLDERRTSTRASPCFRARPSPRRSRSMRRRPSTVIRSVAWDSGWQANISVNGGRHSRDGRTPSTSCSRSASRPAMTS